MQLRDSLAQSLRNFPRKFSHRYSDDAHRTLIELLFFSLAANKSEYLPYFFPNGLPSKSAPWSLSDAQGAVEGAEYSEAARGKRCGHIFRADEATYSCRTCAADDTCVLCAKCFEASDHEGHQVYVSLSQGASGCCDCGDPEAWSHEIKCGIHTALHDSAPHKDGKRPATSLPADLRDGVRDTISTVFDYMCDVFSCAPEHMRSPKHEAAVLKDEELARLVANWYQGGQQDTEPCREFGLVLWNDEKHTMDEVEEQVARACNTRKSYGKEKALEIDRVGRSVVCYGRDLSDLLKKAQILEQIKITVTIRSSRDIFREQMCHDLVQWLTDICGGSVGDDHGILMDTVCGEMLQPWRIGSNASNLTIGKQGLPDHERSDNRLKDMHAQHLQRRVMAARAAARQARVDIELVVGGEARRVIMAVGGATTTPEDDNDEDDEDDDDDDDGNDDDNEDEGEEVLAEIEDEMDLDEALTEDPNILVGTIGVPERHADNMDVQQESSAHEDSDMESQSLSPQKNPDELLAKTNRLALEPKPTVVPPAYWLTPDIKPSAGLHDELPIKENLDKRVRIDFMILYDLRMWKSLRNDLRHLYISTVIKVPQFKRLLGLRFAAVYRVLAQLYLIADREPEHSIINLSLQMLTTPSITSEIIERWNFFTKLLAILYTFLTKRVVGGPEHVDLQAAVAFESGTIANRRIHHFFNDLRYLLESEFVRRKVRDDDTYLLQLLDFLKLHQGICPNKRAIGEHVEYESDSWISAGFIVRDVIKATRMFCDAFKWTKYSDATAITRAIRQTTKTTMINSTGVEHHRFKDQELKAPIKFKEIAPFGSEIACGETAAHSVVDFKVEDAAMSFHHILHYTLSWLVECGKSMSKQQLRGLLHFTHDQLERPDPHSAISIAVPKLDSEQYLLALFDIPLRVCAWLAQIKAGMWVRNGVTLRHQMAMYRSVSQRDSSAQRDIFLLQVALVVCNPTSFLTSIIERYGMTEWMTGNLAVNAGWDPFQMMDVAEEFVHLLAVLVSDRTLLRPLEEEPEPDVAIARRDIAHAMCFKPLAHSELSDKLTMKVQEMDRFDDILHEVTNYKAPEGLQDFGVFELKDEYVDEIDPYNAFYSKNQREDAEKAWRSRKAKQRGKTVDEVVYEPNLKPIKGGLFATLAAFTQTSTFAQVVWACLNVCCGPQPMPDIAATRLETFLPIVLHLALIAIAEDKSFSAKPQPDKSFIDAALQSFLPDEKAETETSILIKLCDLLKMKDTFESSKSKIRLVIQRLQQKRPASFEAAMKAHNLTMEDQTDAMAESKAATELAEKKRRAQERQAKMMASMQKQQSDFLKTQADELGLDEGWTDVAEDLDMDEDGKVRSLSFPRDTCIFCQEETDDQRLYGSLAYMTRSKMFRTTDLSDPDHIGEVEAIPPSYDRHINGLRPFGIAAQNVERVSRATEEGKVVESERKGLGKGWSPSATCVGPVTTSCGHLMHWSCFETFNDATERRQNFQIARNHPERLALKEFVCPLCKALGNTFLPIIWKPKDLVHPSTLASGSFDQWISVQAPFLLGRVSEADLQKREFGHYLTDHLVSRYTPPNAGRSKAPAPELPGAWPHMPAFLSGGAAAAGPPDAPPDASSRQQQRELSDAYKRLRYTMETNDLFPLKGIIMQQTSTSPTLRGEDVLAELLAWSISSAELAHRGVAAEGVTKTVLDTIPASVMTHLRVLAETSFSYSAMASTQGVDARIQTGHQMTRIQVSQLFGKMGADEPLLRGSDDLREALLNEDTFCFLTSAMVFMIPLLRLEPLHIVRVCLLAEVTKVTLAFLENYKSIAGYIRSNEGVYARLPAGGEVQDFSIFVQGLNAQVTSHMGELPESESVSDPFPDLDSNPNSRFAFDSFLYRSVHAYVLPFLRRTLLLLHIRGGVDFESVAKPEDEATEADRLTGLMGLPSIKELIGSCVAETATSRQLGQFVSHWTLEWLLNRHKQPKPVRAAGPLSAASSASSRTSHSGFNETMRTLFQAAPGGFAEVPLTITAPMGDVMQGVQGVSSSKTAKEARKLQLAHPGVYELVALPEMHDTLNALAIAYRCPTTGGPLTDPCLCLLCGEILCGQAGCCSVENPPHSGNREGGCYRHQAKCGGSIGVYLNIRRCAVLFLNGTHGSFFAAPYLDRHGEVDMGMKRRGRLYLNSWRYEKAIRQTWLEHGVQSAIARKLEGDVNSGGWETL